MLICVSSLCLWLIVGCCQASSDTTFSPHEYGCSRFHNYLGPQADWEADLAPAFQQSSFTVVIHGVAGAGKSALTAMLCGSEDGPLLGPKDLNDDNGIRSVTNASRIYTCRSRTGTDSSTIYAIDTPGFQEFNEMGQLQTLMGLDQAYHLALEKGAPLRRLYFVLDWTSTTEPIPVNLKAQLRILLNRYGASIAPRIRFVISKCDRLTRMEVSKVRIQQLMLHLVQCYSEVFDYVPAANIIIFVSVVPDERQCRSILQLTKDLVRASKEFMIVDSRDGLLDGQLPHLKSLHDLHRLTIALQQRCGLNSVSVPDIRDSYRNLLDLRGDIKVVEQAARRVLYYFYEFSFQLACSISDQKVTQKVFQGVTMATSFIPVPPLKWVAKGASYAIFKGCQQGAIWNEKKLEEAQSAYKELLNCLNGLERDLALMCGCSSQD